MALTRFQVTPTVTVPGTAYVQNDVVGGLRTFTGLRGGKLRGITLADKAAQITAVYKLILFESSPTSIADNANADLNDADPPKIIFEWDIPNGASPLPIDKGQFSGITSFNDNAYFWTYGMDYPLWSAGGTVYGFLILTTTAVPTFASTTDVTISLLVEMGA